MGMFNLFMISIDAYVTLFAQTLSPTLDFNFDFDSIRYLAHTLDQGRFNLMFGLLHEEDLHCVF